MAHLKRVKSGPAIPAIRPIEKPTSRGVVEEGAKALFDHRNKGLPDNKKESGNGRSLGTKISGGGSISGASV